MSDKYKINDKEGVYFVTLTAVDFNNPVEEMVVSEPQHYLFSW